MTDDRLAINRAGITAIHAEGQGVWRLGLHPRAARAGQDKSVDAIPLVHCIRHERPRWRVGRTPSNTRPPPDVNWPISNRFPSVNRFPKTDDQERRRADGTTK